MAKSTHNAHLTKARPVGHGKDPLAEGNTLVNPSNSTDETHYEVKERSDDVRKASETASQNTDAPAEQPEAPATPATDTPNSDETEQAEVAEGRAEADTETTPETEAPAPDTPEAPAPPAEVPAENLK